MKAKELAKLIVWSAKEYHAGFEIPVWKNGQWQTVAQFKLDAFV